MLLITCSVVVLSFLLQVRPDQHVGFSWLPGVSFPQTCLSRSLYDVKCPGCGLTRSLVHLAHGDWNASMTIHRLGWLVAIAVLLQFPYRIIMLSRSGDPIPGGGIPKIFGYVMIVLLTGNWILGFVV